MYNNDMLGEAGLRGGLKRLKGITDGHTSQLAQIAPLHGAGAPATSTVGAVGQLYLDTTPTTGRLYVCNAAVGGVYTWIPQALKSVVDGKANAGSNALIETITLSEAVNTVTPVNIGSNVYDELMIEYIGTASVATPTLYLKDASNNILAQTPLTSMTSTRYISVNIARVAPGSGAIAVRLGSTASRATMPTLYGGVMSDTFAAGLSNFKFTLDGTNTFSIGGVFKIWGRKWAL